MYFIYLYLYLFIFIKNTFYLFIWHTWHFKQFWWWKINNLECTMENQTFKFTSKLYVQDQLMYSFQWPKKANNNWLKSFSVSESVIFVLECKANIALSQSLQMPCCWPKQRLTFFCDSGSETEHADITAACNYHLLVSRLGVHSLDTYFWTIMSNFNMFEVCPQKILTSLALILDNGAELWWV